jgi:hypothetical protein
LIQQKQEQKADNRSRQANVHLALSLGGALNTRPHLEYEPRI